MFEILKNAGILWTFYNMCDVTSMFHIEAIAFIQLSNDFDSTSLQNCVLWENTKHL